jgi:hypothetical protein
MKKFLFVIVSAALLMSFQSCKKDYTCKCTLTAGNVDIAYTKVKKSDAQESCDAAETTYKTADATANCDLQ